MQFLLKNADKRTLETYILPILYIIALSRISLYGTESDVSPSSGACIIWRFTSECWSVLYYTWDSPINLKWRRFASDCYISAFLLRSIVLVYVNGSHMIQIGSRSTSGRMLNGELYVQRLQTLICICFFYRLFLEILHETACKQMQIN